MSVDVKSCMCIWLFTVMHLQKRRVLSSEEDFLLALPSDGLE